MLQENSNCDERRAKFDGSCVQSSTIIEKIHQSLYKRCWLPPRILAKWYKTRTSARRSLYWWRWRWIDLMSQFYQSKENPGVTPQTRSPPPDGKRMITVTFVYVKIQGLFVVTRRLRNLQVLVVAVVLTRKEQRRARCFPISVMLVVEHSWALIGFNGKFLCTWRRKVKGRYEGCRDSVVSHMFRLSNAKGDQPTETPSQSASNSVGWKLRSLDANPGGEGRHWPRCSLAHSLSICGGLRCAHSCS